jgi:hypothetical protein
MRGAVLPSGRARFCQKMGGGPWCVHPVDAESGRIFRLIPKFPLESSPPPTNALKRQCGQGQVFHDAAGHGAVCWCLFGLAPIAVITRKAVKREPHQSSPPLRVDIGTIRVRADRPSSCILVLVPGARTRTRTSNSYLRYEYEVQLVSYQCLLADVSNPIALLIGTTLL